jgi:hypothetical protein
MNYLERNTGMSITTNNEERERLVRVETMVGNIQQQQVTNAQAVQVAQQHTTKDLDALKESIVSLRINSEVQLKTIDQLGMSAQSVSARVDGHESRLHTIESSMGITKVRAIAYVAGLGVGLSILWAIVGDPVRDFTKHIFTVQATMSTTSGVPAITIAPAIKP